MPECAFCDHQGKLTAEHYVGQWMDELFQGENIHSREAKGKTTQWTKHDEIDWNACVVCEECNTTWMSNIENDHAKPVLTPFILGQTTPTIEITQSVSRSIALWVFKIAVVLDHANRRGEPWFPKHVREQFRTDRAIYSSVKMWICGVKRGRQYAGLYTSYGSMNFASTYPIDSYVCTGSIGHFAFQLFCAKQNRDIDLFPLPEFDQVAIPVWPGIWQGITWPFRFNLDGKQGVDDFSKRWNAITLDPPFR
jgi:hypothetical protein